MFRFDSDAYKKNSGETKKMFEYSFPPPSSLLHHLNNNGDTEYTILEGIIFHFVSLITVNQVVTCWITDMPTHTTNNILPIVTTILNIKHNDIDVFNNVQSEDVQQTRIQKVTK